MGRVAAPGAGAAAALKAAAAARANTAATVGRLHPRTSSTSSGEPPRKRRRPLADGDAMDDSDSGLGALLAAADGDGGKPHVRFAPAAHVREIDPDWLHYSESGYEPSHRTNTRTGALLGQNPAPRPTKRTTWDLETALGVLTSLGIDMGDPVAYPLLVALYGRPVFRSWDPWATPDKVVAATELLMDPTLVDPVDKANHMADALLYGGGPVARVRRSPRLRSQAKVRRGASRSPTRRPRPRRRS